MVQPSLLLRLLSQFLSFGILEVDRDTNKTFSFFNRLLGTYPHVIFVKAPSKSKKSFNETVEEIIWIREKLGENCLDVLKRFFLYSSALSDGNYTLDYCKGLAVIWRKVVYSIDSQIDGMVSIHIYDIKDTPVSNGPWGGAFHDVIDFPWILRT